MTNFDKAMTILAHNEGGFANNQHDNGGATKFGISAASYPGVDIASLTFEDAKEIYKQDFWKPLSPNDYSFPVAIMLFDTAVHSGHTRAVRIAQEASGAVGDGIIGPKTKAALKGVNSVEFCIAYTYLRLDFLQGLTDWRHFGRGWQARLYDTLTYAIIHASEEEQHEWQNNIKKG